jgi:hypothetical protein
LPTRKRKVSIDASNYHDRRVRRNLQSTTHAESQDHAFIFRLFDLPGEIREMIYHCTWLLKPRIVVDVHAEYGEPSPASASNFEFNQFPIWTRASARLRHEALDQFYRCAKFTLTFPKWHSCSCPVRADGPNIKGAQNLRIECEPVYYPWYKGLGIPQDTMPLPLAFRLLWTFHALRDLHIQFQNPKL